MLQTDSSVSRQSLSVNQQNVDSDIEIISLFRMLLPNQKIMVKRAIEYLVRQPKAELIATTFYR